MKVVSCRKHNMQLPYFIAWSNWLSGGRYKPPSGSRAEPWWGSRGEAPGSSSDPAVHSTKKMSPKNHFLGRFLSVCCIQIERKNLLKLKKFMSKANNSTSCSVNISKPI